MPLSSRLQHRLSVAKGELPSQPTDSTTDALSPTAQRLTETFGRLNLPPTMRTMLVVMERRLRGKADSEVRDSLLSLGQALITVAGGAVAELPMPAVVDATDEEEEEHAVVADIAALHAGGG